MLPSLVAPWPHNCEAGAQQIQERPTACHSCCRRDRRATRSYVVSRRRSAAWMTLAIAIGLGPGCEVDDVGTPCRAFLGRSLPAAGDSRTETAAVVGQSIC